MKQSKVKFNDNDSYNMNCDIDELVKLGFKNSTYHHDVAPSYTNQKGNIQIFFFDLDDEGIKAEGITNKYTKFLVQKFNDDGEYLGDVGIANKFDEMLRLVAKATLSLAFGDEFMESDDKGTLKEYKKFINWND
tara:strand:+ start:275 stop:676 length:402 start_codon:yes stop_codon:yes gene_type:complete